MHLISWGRVCRPKKDGGLGILDMGEMNLALLCKWWWRFIENPNKVVPRLITAKYGSRNRTWLGTPWNRSSTSKFYKDIALVKNIFHTALRTMTGDGTRVRFWEDNWCGPITLASDFLVLYRAVKNKYM